MNKVSLSKLGWSKTVDIFWIKINCELIILNS